MIQLTIDLPETTFSIFKQSPKEFSTEMKLTALAKWYEDGKVSQSKAAEIAGVSRQMFLEELYIHNVSPYQISEEDLINEVR